MRNQLLELETYKEVFFSSVCPPQFTTIIANRQIASFHYKPITPRFLFLFTTLALLESTLNALNYFLPVYSCCVCVEEAASQKDITIPLSISSYMQALSKKFVSLCFSLAPVVIRSTVSVPPLGFIRYQPPTPSRSEACMAMLRSLRKRINQSLLPSAEEL